MAQAVETKDDIIKALRDHRSMLRSLCVKRIGIFGSFVHGRQAPTSDVDMLVEFEPGLKTFDRFMQLSFFLEDILQRPVELVTPESLSPHIGPHILQEVEYVSVAA